jgi:N-acetylglucosaminyldiphosphoundecaprenol N-acetyl-beta-D-mannosaminyltransferase
MSLYILRTKVDQFSKKEVLDKIKRVLVLPLEKPCHLVTTNPEFVLEAQKNIKFRDIVNDSWLSVADGYGLRLAAKYLEISKNKNNIFVKFFLGLKVAWWGFWHVDKKLDVIKDIVTGSDLVSEITELAHQIKKEENIINKVFLLGGFGDVPEKAICSLKKQISSDLDIVGYNFETEDKIAKINESKATILFVALSQPRAQLWINENLSKMNLIKLVVGVGGSFDYLAGEVKRAPLKSRYHFEWLFRLFYQPKRWKRIFRAVFVFPWLVFKKSITLDTK